MNKWTAEEKERRAERERIKRRKGREESAAKGREHYRYLRAGDVVGVRAALNTSYHYRFFILKKHNHAVMPRIPFTVRWKYSYSEPPASW